MARSSTTRKGNGAGWGGQAKGEGKKGAVDGSGRPAGVKTGEGKRSVADIMAEMGARELAAQRWLEILNDPTHPQHAAMVDKAATRLDGAPLARMEHSVRDVPAEELTDDELAAVIRRGGGAIAGAEADQD